jgi:PAS domain S-box-containing protein
MIAGPYFGNYQAGFRFGRLGYELVEKRQLKRFEARTYLLFGSFVIPWTKHVQAGRDLVRRAFEVASKGGDLTFAAYSCYNLNTILLAAGDPLKEVQHEAENGLQFAQKTRFGLVVDFITAQLALIRTLRGATPKFGSFDDGKFDELEFESHLANDRAPLPECFYWIRKLQARFFAGDYASAIDASVKTERLLWSLPSRFESAEYHFYAALSRAACCDTAFISQAGPASLPSNLPVELPDEGLAKSEHFQILLAHQKQLEAWAENCLENFETRVALIGAEIARIEGRVLDAERLYEEAIRSAHANGFVHNQALANELAARFYAARGFEKIAHVYLRDARYCYRRWGAGGKVQQLDELYPYLREEEPTLGPTSTIGAMVEHLDVATVIKVSQALSGEIVLEKLIETLMRNSIEHAGAERGLLILPRGFEQRIEAEATISGDSIIVRSRDASVATAPLPESIVHYVVRTREIVILDDAAERNPFSADPYIAQHHAHSILCLPLINQARLIGVLYLENNLTSRVFTPGRIAMLKLLASQAAISLENTRLYRDLEEREARIRRLVDANIIGIYVWNLEGEIIEANEAFLHMVAYSREDLLSGRVHWRDLTPVEWRDRDDRVVAELKTTGTCQPFQKEYYRKDGSRVPVLLGAAMFEGSGNEGVAFVLDLSEQRQAEEALRLSEERWSKLAENSSAGIALIAPDGRFIAANLALQQMLGYTEDELQRHTISDITLPEDRAATEAGIVEALAGLRPIHRVEKRYLRKDGGICWADLSRVFVPASGTTSAFFSAVIVDITERKRAEEELHRREAELAHVSRVTTMGELAASIAHEVNQPLAGIATNANASLRWLAGELPNLHEAREAIRRIIRDGSRANDVISRMRALFKKDYTAKERLDLNEVIEEVVTLIKSEVRRNKVVLRTELATNLPSIMGDRVQIQQVLMNLVLNAIEAMSTVEDRERDLLIRTQRGEGDEVRIAVRDSGTGFDLKNTERLFAAFHTTKPGGMGMGLSISRSIVQSHGGRLSAVLNDGSGATFQFTLLKSE